MKRLALSLAIAASTLVSTSASAGIEFRTNVSDVSGFELSCRMSSPSSPNFKKIPINKEIPYPYFKSVFMNERSHQEGATCIVRKVESNRTDIASSFDIKLLTAGNYNSSIYGIYGSEITARGTSLYNTRTFSNDSEPWKTIITFDHL